MVQFLCPIDILFVISSTGITANCWGKGKLIENLTSGIKFSIGATLISEAHGFQAM